MSAAGTDTPAGAAAALYPPYMAELVDRGAELLRVHFPSPGPVRITWWADGEERAYLARLHWPIDGSADGPRTLVLDACTGMLVCASLPGQLFTIDPASVDIDTMGTDEMARAVWEARRHGR